MKTFQSLLGKKKQLFFSKTSLFIVFNTLISGFIFSQNPEKTFSQKLEGLRTSSKELVKSASTDNSSVGQSGQLNTSVPLITVKSRTLSFPIQLSYQSGIKVEQKSGPVGLGWGMPIGSITRDYGAFQPDYSSTSHEASMTNYMGSGVNNAHINPNTHSIYPYDYYNYLKLDNIDVTTGKGSLADKYHVSIPQLSGSFWNNGASNAPHTWEWENFENSKVDFTLKTFQIAQDFSRINEGAVNNAVAPNYTDKTKFDMNMEGSWTAAIGVLPYTINGKAYRPTSNIPTATEKIVEYEDFETFTITGTDGLRYVFGRPLRGQKFIFNDNPYWNSIDNQSATSISNNFWKIDYIAEWLLTTVLSVDYLDANGNGIADDGDAGDWIRFEYTEPVKNIETTPYGDVPGNKLLQSVPTHREWSNFSQTDQSSSLMRERAYLALIITPTERYDFRISQKFDVDHDFYSKPANKVGTYHYFEDRQYSTSGSSEASTEDFDVQFPVETMKYDSIFSYSRLIDENNYPQENTLKGAIALNYADKGSSQELAVSSYLIRDNNNSDKLIDKPSDGDVFNVEDYKNVTIKRGKTTLLSVDFLDDQLESAQKSSYEFQYAYNPSYDEVHKRSILKKHFFPSVRSTDHSHPDNDNELSINYSEKILNTINGIYNVTPTNHTNIYPYDFLIDFPYEETYFKYSSIDQSTRKSYVETNAVIPSSEPISSNQILQPLQPIQDVFGYFYADNCSKCPEAWSLTQITYPLGGTAEFEYEQGNFELNVDRNIWHRTEDELPIIENYNNLAKKRSLRQDLYNKYALDISPNPFGLTDPITGLPAMKTLTASFSVAMPSAYGIRLKKKTVDDKINPPIVLTYSYENGHFTNIPSEYVQNLFSGFNQFMTRENFRHKWERLYHWNYTTNALPGWTYDLAEKMGFHVSTDVSLHDYSSNHFYENSSTIYSDGSKTTTHYFLSGDLLTDFRDNSFFNRTKITPSIKGAGYIFGGGKGYSKHILPKKTEYYDANSSAPYKYELTEYDQVFENLSANKVNFMGLPLVNPYQLWSNSFEMWLPLNKIASPSLSPYSYYYSYSSSGQHIKFEGPLPAVPIPGSYISWTTSGNNPSSGPPVFGAVKDHVVHSTESFITITLPYMYAKKIIRPLKKTAFYKGLITSEEYFYDSKNRLNKTVSTSSSNSDQIIETTTYADDSYNGITTKFTDLNLLSSITKKTSYLNTISNVNVLSANIATYDYTLPIPKNEANYVYETTIANPDIGTFLLASPFSFSAANSVEWRKLESKNLGYNMDGAPILAKQNRIYSKNVLGNSKGSIKAQISSSTRPFDATYTGFEDINDFNSISNWNPQDYKEESWFIDGDPDTDTPAQSDDDISNPCGYSVPAQGDPLFQPYIKEHNLVFINNTNGDIQVGDAVRLELFGKPTSVPAYYNFEIETTIASIHTGITGPAGKPHAVCFTNPITYPSSDGQSGLINGDWNSTGLIINVDDYAGYTIASTKLTKIGDKYQVSKRYARTGKYSYKLKPKEVSTDVAEITPIRPVKIFQTDIPLNCQGPADPNDPVESGPENNSSNPECNIPYQASVWLRHDFNISKLGGDQQIVTKSQDAVADQIYRRKNVNTVDVDNTKVRIVCDVWSFDRTYLSAQHIFYPEGLNDSWQQYTVDVNIPKGAEKFIDVYIVNDKIESSSTPTGQKKSLFVDDLLVYPEDAKYSYSVLDKFGNTTFSSDNNDVFVENKYDSKGRNIANKNAYGKTTGEKFYFDQAIYPAQNNHLTERVWTNNGQFNDTRFFLDGFGKTKQAMKSDLVRNIRIVSETNVHDAKGNTIQSYKPYYLVNSALPIKHDVGYPTRVSSLYGTDFGYSTVDYESKPEQFISSASSPRMNTEFPSSSIQANYPNNVALTNPHQPSQTYGVGTLIFHEVTDEVGSKTRTFIDAWGRVIMEEAFIGSSGHTQNAGGSVTVQVNTTESARTWYLYDKSGRLVKTFDPDGKTSSYTYNSANFLVESNTPDKGVIHVRYNKFGQIRFTQNQRDLDAVGASNYQAKQLEYIKYDSWGRALEDGVTTTAPNSLGVSTTNPPFTTPDYFNNYAYVNDHNFPDENAVFVQVHHRYEYDGTRDQFNSSSLIKESTFTDHILNTITFLYSPVFTDETEYEYMADGQLARKEYFVDGLANSHTFEYNYNSLRMPIGKKFLHGGNSFYDFEWRNELDYWGRPVRQETIHNFVTNLNSRQFYDPIGNVLMTGIGPLDATGEHLDYQINKLNIRDQMVGYMSTHFNFGLKYDASGNMKDQYWKNTEYDPIVSGVPHVNRYNYTYDKMKRLICADYSDVSTGSISFTSIDNILATLPSDYSCGAQTELALETAQPVFDQLEIDEVESDQPELAREGTDVLNILMSEYLSLAIPYATLTAGEKTEFFDVFFNKVDQAREDIYAFEKYKAYSEGDQEHLDALYEAEGANEALLIYTKILMSEMPTAYPIVCAPNTNSIVHNFSPDFPFPTSTISSDKYDAAYWYSKNGNTTQLNRNDDNGDKDIQQYTYLAGKNWLTSVDWTDGTTNTSAPSTYWYDPIGNLTSDSKSDVDAITYNLLSSLPETIEQTIQGTQYTRKYRYDAQGQRLAKEVSSNDKEYYLEEVILDINGDVKSYQTGIGYAVPNDATQNIAYFYNVKDWLGTNRAVLDETGMTVNVTDHYPYGEKMPARWNVTDNEGNRFQFTGHEQDGETAYEYHGARYYNRTLGRYLSVDPLAIQFQSHSPYNYVMGNPIMLIDPDGKEPIRPFAGTVMSFWRWMNTLSSGIGESTGNKAHNAMLRMGEIKFVNFSPKPENTAPFNTAGGNRYLYTTKGGWIDMAHFMFYAGRAYKHQQDKAWAQKEMKSKRFLLMGEDYIARTIALSKTDPIGEAVQEGYIQEKLDEYGPTYSAYSYEDLPSDKFGAEFATKHFDPKSNISFGEQIVLYLLELGVTNPENAPNYNSLPTEYPDKGENPTSQNKTTTPMFIEN